MGDFLTKVLAKRIWSRKVDPAGKISEAQSHVPAQFTAAALLQFRRDLRECYSDETWKNVFGAVGPQETFVGWLVKTGRITINDPPKA